MDWIKATTLPAEHEDVLCWDGVRMFVGYVEREPEDNPTEANWYGSWTKDLNHAEVLFWRKLPTPPEVIASGLTLIKHVLANESPEQIGADIGGQVTDYDLRYKPNGNNGRGQHPEFFGEDEKQQVDK